jgi:hypothetical protein
MNSLGEVTGTRLGTFRLDSAGSEDLRETPGLAELTLSSGGTLRASDGVASEARAVDVRTGRPVAWPGTEVCDPNGLFGPPDASGCLVPGSSGAQSRQLFDDLCSVTVGVASIVTEALAERCLLDVLNDHSVELISAFLFPDNPQPITNPLTQLTFSGFFANLFVGNNAARNAAALLAGNPNLFIPLNVDPCDGFLEDCTTPGASPNTAFANASPSLNQTLTVQQQALLGCGPFYGTNCEVDGIDLFHTEGGVGVQSFPQVEPDPQVATRVVNDQVVKLPGASGPGDFGYSPLVDGCTGPRDPSIFGSEACGQSNGGAGAHPLVNPLTGEPFPNELAVVSYNFMIFQASLSLPDPDCDPDPRDPDCDPGQGNPDCNLTTEQGLIACGVLSSVFDYLARELEDDPSGPPQTRWLWETGAEYLQTDEATGGLAGLANWTFHAVGPEVSRRDGADEAGVLFLLFPPGEVLSASPPMAAPGPDFVALYGVVPAPSQGVLQLAALLAAAGFARWRRRL